METHLFKLDPESKFYKEEVKYLFKNEEIEYICIVIQRAKNLDDFAGNSQQQKSEAFMEYCLEQFMPKCEKIKNTYSGFFDYVDPMSGITMVTSNPNNIYPEIAGCREFLIGKSEYFIKTIQNFEILAHPECDINVYISTMFFGPGDYDEIQKLII